MQHTQLVSWVSRPLRQALCYLAMTLSCCGAISAQAGVIPFPDENVSYNLHGEQLKDFLKRFFNDMGIAVSLSDLVQTESASLNGPRSGKASAVCKSIMESNGLVGYYDGSVAYVYKNRELADRFFRIEAERMEAFHAATVSAGLPDASNTLKINAGMVSAHGTPRFLDQLGQLYTAFAMRPAHSQRVAKEPREPAAPRGPAASGTTLHMISLKYAWAADTTFSIGTTKTVIPGVATLLRQVLGLQSESGGGKSPPVSGTTNAFKGLRGSGMQATTGTARPAVMTPAALVPPPPPAPNPGQGQNPAGTDGYGVAPPPTLAEGGPGPRIVADPYRNALIIRDTADRMAMYDDLVRQLDVESQIIQLDATIIDIDRSKVSQLGIDWDYRNLRNGVNIGINTGTTNISGGLQVNGIVGNVAQFAANVRALEQNGVTNAVQRPQVVTLGDTEAVIQSTQTVYVPVSGAYDEDLYNVQAGTTLRVTPHIINDHGRQRIRLLVSIEDGSLTVSAQPTTQANGQTLSQPVPTVLNNAVNTQAIIDVGEGLLLGGLVSHERTTNTSQVPVLGNIPLVGRLFRNDSVKKTDTERLFLISPKIIIASAANGPAPDAPQPQPPH